MEGEGSMAKIIVRVAGFFVWLVALLVALLLAAAFVPTIFGLESLVVASGSMTPAMAVGSVAMTHEVDARSISAGDIISFRHRGVAETTTHRVIGVKTQGSQVIFTTKGDANGAPDPEPVVVDGKIHKVEYVIPAAGYAVRYARTPLGVVVLFLIPLAGLAFERRKRGRHVPPNAPIGEIGWSATTQSLLRLGPDQLRSGPSG
jgi:signal peptidase